MTPHADDHIVKSYDEELKHLENLIAEMGGLAEVQLAEAIDALVKRDSEKAERVIAADQRIDDLEIEIENFAVHMVARRQPMARDLRTIIAALKTATVIERVGDYAKNIAKRAVALAQAPAMQPTGTVARMGRLAQGMVKRALDAYIARDAAMADDVRASDLEIDAIHTSLFRELLTYMMEDPRNITPCTHLLFVAKNIERVGDYATTIAESVIFLVRGKIPSDKRPKGDESSFTVVEPGRPKAGGGDERRP
jgi:phosphate transport system protein